MLSLLDYHRAVPIRSVVCENETARRTGTARCV